MSDNTVIAAFTHTNDDRETQFVTRLYADGTTDCTCPEGSWCYMSKRISRVIFPQIKKGKTAEQFYGRTIRHVPDSRIVEEVKRQDSIPVNKIEDPGKRRYNL